MVKWIKIHVLSLTCYITFCHFPTQLTSETITKTWTSFLKNKTISTNPTFCSFIPQILEISKTKISRVTSDCAHYIIFCLGIRTGEFFSIKDKNVDSRNILSILCHRVYSLEKAKVKYYTQTQILARWQRNTTRGQVCSFRLTYTRKANLTG